MEIDFLILDFIQNIRTFMGDIFFSNFTKLGDSGLLWIILIILAIIYPKTRKLGVCLALSLIINFLLCNVLIKPTVARIRPYEINTDIELLVNKPKDYSFPSGHTSAAFSFVLPLMIYRLKKLWIPFFIVAITFSFSRLYLYVHYPTDILGGIVVGIIAGFLSCYLCKWFLNITKDNCINT